MSEIISEPEETLDSGQINLERSIKGRLEFQEVSFEYDSHSRVLHDISFEVEPGQTVAASFQAPALFTIGQDLSRMDLTVYVSEADVGQVGHVVESTKAPRRWATCPRPPQVVHVLVSPSPIFTSVTSTSGSSSHVIDVLV